jgi:dipeptidyl aminopeptidase/acylaminoacyl peptidase
MTLRPQPRPAFALSAVVLALSPWCSPPVSAGDDATADAALIERVTAMGSIGGSFAPSFAPDGRRIAFLSNRSGLPQVWVADLENGSTTQITQGEDPAGSVAWSDDGRSLAWSVAKGGGYSVQIFIGAPDGSDAKRITAGGDENNFPGDFARDGRYYFSSNARDPKGTDGWIHDPATGRTTLAVRNPGIGAIADIEMPPQRVLVERTVTRGNDDLWLVELEGGKETLLTPHRGPALVGGSLAPDGSAVYLEHNLERDRVALSRIAIDANGRPGERRMLAERDDAELSAFVLAPKGDRGVLVWNAGGRSELELIELPQGTRRALPAAPAEIVSGVDFSPDGRRVVMALNGSTLPSDIWTLDLDAQSYARVTQTPHPGVDLATLVTPTLHRFRAHDGLELSGWLYLPRDFARPGPVVLSFHGGPEGQERPVFRADYQALLSQGIAVFAPNIRGSSGFGKAFLVLDNHEKRFDANRDIEAAASAMIDAGIGAAGRLGIMGGSYGGYATMVGITDYPRLFAAGANLYGIVNFKTFFSHSTPWMGAVSVGEYGDPATQSELLDRLSPIHKLDRVEAATLVMHGANDTNVPVIEAEQVVNTLKARGVPVEYVLFPDEGHGWRKTPNRIRSTVELVRFFDRHLKRDAAVPASNAGDAG